MLFGKNNYKLKTLRTLEGGFPLTCSSDAAELEESKLGEGDPVEAANPAEASREEAEAPLSLSIAAAAAKE